MNLLSSPPPPCLLYSCSTTPLRNTRLCHNHNHNRVLLFTRTGACEDRGSKLKVKALSDVSSSVDPVQAQITWEIVVGSLAGVIPFVVAGIEFNKRIVAQRKCNVCGGSGLVLRDKKYYFRCPGCGGFLPWQSWKRFFSG